MKNVSKTKQKKKQEYVKWHLLNARLQTTEKPSGETKKILYKQSLATDPKSLILIFCFLTLCSCLLCYFPLQSKPDWSTLTVFTRCHAQILPAFSLCSTCSFILGLDMDTHTSTNCNVSCFCYGSSCAHVWLGEPDTENNEQLTMTNSVCWIPAEPRHHCVFVCVCLYAIEPRIQKVVY